MSDLRSSKQGQVVNVYKLLLLQRKPKLGRTKPSNGPPAGRWLAIADVGHRISLSLRTTPFAAAVAGAGKTKSRFRSETKERDGGAPRQRGSLATGGDDEAGCADAGEGCGWGRTKFFERFWYELLHVRFCVKLGRCFCVLATFAKISDNHLQTWPVFEGGEGSG